MKVAIVHDYIKEYGGAERVLEELLGIYPNACVYTSLYAPKFLGPHRARFEKYKIHQSFFRFIPFSYKLISPLRLLSPLAFMSFNLSKYDIVIVSQTGAYFPNMVRTKSAGVGEIGAVHICYTHTPPRYLYGYMTARDWRKNALARVFSEFVNHFLRIIDYHAAQRVDHFVANSEEVKRRIAKFYKKDAVVIYPPAVSTSRVKNVESRKDGSASSASSGRENQYFLAGGRLARAKGMDVIMDAFIKSGCSLKIFGKGFAGFEEELLSKIKRGESNIEFVGEVSDEEKMRLMAGATAYIFASYDEDFGITPVEAMSVGTPVVAFKSGGVQETVVDEKTGVFYSPNKHEELNKAVNKLERLKIKSSDCTRRAEKFSDTEFDYKIKKLVAEVT